MIKHKYRPFSVKFFVPTGNPNELRVIEKANWTGVGIVFNRKVYKELLNRSEFSKTGVYMLIGESADSNLPTLFIGEGSPVKNKFDQHFSKDKFWNWSVFFASKEESLNRTHVKFLESRFIELISEAKLCKLNNSQSSLQPTLSQAEIADTENFLLDILSILPLIGLNVF